MKIKLIIASLILLAIVHLNSNAACLSAEINFGEGISVPEFPGAKDIWDGAQIVEVNGVTTRMACFGFNNPINDILDFYKTQLPKLGWQLNQTWKDFNAISFTKEGNFLYVASTDDVSPFTKFVLILSKQEIQLCLAQAANFGLDAQERQGRDLPFIPRYPGSIRTSYVIKGDKEAFFVYSVRANVKDILDFYRNSLPAFGWRFSERLLLPSTGKDSFLVNILKFNRRNKDTLSIYINYYPASQVNIITICYNNAFTWPAGPFM